MSDRDLLYLVYIKEAIERIRDYTAGGEDAFRASSLVQDAVLRNLQTLAESAKRLSREARSLHPEIDWPQLTGFRNRAVHDYMAIEVDLVWGIVVTDLPPLLAAVEHLINLHPPEE